MILVTGGTGYIGSQMCVALAQAGHEVLIVDNLCNSRADVIMHVRVTVGGRLPEAKAVAAELMAELAELDRSVHVSVELGKGSQ